MAKLTLNPISAGYASNTALNTNNGLIETALENTLSRDGTGPNQMGAQLDMNSNKIVNLAAPTNANDAARLTDVQAAIAGLPTASTVPYTATGSNPATTVQGAIDELDIHTRTNKTTPVGADEFLLWDSVSTFLRRLSLTNLTAYFAALTSTWAISTTGNAATATLATTATTATTANTLATTAAEKLPAIGCTQAGGALTFTASSQYLDFRSATLTSGTITTINAAPASLVLPSGGTLGAVTTVSARIIVVEINNAGTAELAIINIAGGVDLSETGIINTTAISAASTASNVFYSTSARTGVAYRVVGAVDAVNTAGAWGNPTLVQPAGGNALTAMGSLGYGQTWQNLTGSRSLGTTYYNTTGKPIYCQVQGYGSPNNGAMSATVNGVSLGTCGVASIASGSYYPNIGFIVPPGGSYSASNVSGTSLANWAELR